MRRIAVILVVVCLLAVITNEIIRGKYGFASDRHFVVFWLVWMLAIVGMGIAVGLLLSQLLPQPRLSAFSRIDVDEKLGWRRPMR